jgi:hypothetical protein
MANKSDIAKEALMLADQALKELELSEASLTSIALKASRIARITGNFEMQQIMLYEAGGYPFEPTGVPPEIWQLALKAGRIIREKEDGGIKEYAKLKSLEQLESEINTAKERLKVSQDADVSVSSSNPQQFVSSVTGNSMERFGIAKVINDTSKLIGQRRAFIYQYLSDTYYELRYSVATDDSFSRIRTIVDENLASLVPNALQKFSAISDNLESENTEDWSNAVHICRRVLQDLADALYPPTGDVTKNVNGNDIIINLGADAYINRLIDYAEQNSNSTRFNEIVGSHMRFLGERLDAIFQAAQKGSHSNIVTRGEADRYVVYTYMVVGDLMSLKLKVEQQVAKA